MRATSFVNTLSITVSTTIEPEALPQTEHTPALDLLFSRAHRTSMSDESIPDYWVKKLVQHQPTTVPISTLLARSDPELSECPYYLCCELVEYTAGMNDVYVRRLGNLKDVSAQSEHYKKVLHNTFGEAVIRPISIWPSLFILGLQDNPEIFTTKANNAETRPLSEVLPKGPKAQFWISKMNEIQMSLHQSNENINNPVTTQKPNGVWLWGEGTSSTIPNSPLSVSAQSPQLLALSQAANAKLTSYEYLFDDEAARSDALIEILIDENPKSLAKANGIASQAIVLLKSGRYTELNTQIMKKSVLHNARSTKYSLRKFWKKTINTLDWLREADD
jgi:hypothetical protein